MFFDSYLKLSGYVPGNVKKTLFKTKFNKNCKKKFLEVEV